MLALWGKFCSPQWITVYLHELSHFKSFERYWYFPTTYSYVTSLSFPYIHFPIYLSCPPFTGKILCMNDVYVTHRANWVRITWGFTRREFATSNCWLVFHYSTAWLRSTESNSSLFNRRLCGQDLRGVTSARRPPHNVHLLTAVPPLVQQGRICRFYRALAQQYSRSRAI